MRPRTVIQPEAIFHHNDSIGKQRSWSDIFATSRNTTEDVNHLDQQQDTEPKAKNRHITLVQHMRALLLQLVLEHMPDRVKALNLDQ